MAQVDAFLKLDKVDGESIDDTHTKEIDVLAWSWGVSNSGSAQHATGAGTGKASISDLQITKMVDKASPVLWGNATKGTHIASGVLTVRKAGDTPLDYFKVEMKKILVSHVSFGGSSDGTISETISLNFGSFLITYLPQLDTGAAGAGVPFGYDIAKNLEIAKI